MMERGSLSIAFEKKGRGKEKAVQMVFITEPVGAETDSPLGSNQPSPQMVVLSFYDNLAFSQ
jgi:hypothetical protein